MIDVKDKGKFFKKLFVKFDYGKYEFSLPSKFIPKIIDYILLARSFQDNSLYDKESNKKLQAMDLDLSDLIRYIEEGINSFFSLKCQYNQSLNNKQNLEFQNIVNEDRSYVPNYNNQSKQINYTQSHYRPNYYRPNHPQQPQMYQRRLHDYPNSHYVDNNFISHIGYPGIRKNEDFKNYLEPKYIKNNYYPQNIPQNIYGPNRFQNYKPQEFFNPDNDSFHDKTGLYDHRQDFDEKNILMKRLEREQKSNQQFNPQSNNIRNKIFDDLPTYRNYDSTFITKNSLKNSQKNHLSDFFCSNNSHIDNQYKIQKDIFEFDKTNQNKMMELKKEKYSLKETLKKLDTKFEEGIISEVDYFRTFKNLQKELYLTDKKIESLNAKLQEEQFLRRNFNKKKYFS